MRALLLLVLCTCRGERLVDAVPFDAGEHEVTVYRFPTPEFCNGLDDDLNGKVDDIDLSLCYSGPQESLSFGECRPGIVRCVRGTQKCIGEVSPRPEICNHVDDDCDGEVDEGFEPRVDVVVIVDNSSSMAGVIASVREAVIEAMNDFAAFPEVRWAVVGAPGTFTVNSNVIAPRLDYPFGDARGAIEVMRRQDGQSGSGFEPTVDALYQVDTGTLVKWGTNQRLILLFTDEPPQSALNVPSLKPAAETVIFTDESQANFVAYGAQYPLGNQESMYQVIASRMQAKACP